MNASGTGGDELPGGDEIWDYGYVQVLLEEVQSEIRPVYERSRPCPLENPYRRPIGRKIKDVWNSVLDAQEPDSTDEDGQESHPKAKFIESIDVATENTRRLLEHHSDRADDAGHQSVIHTFSDETGERTVQRREVDRSNLLPSHQDIMEDVYDKMMVIAETSEQLHPKIFECSQDEVPLRFEDGDVQDGGVPREHQRAVYKNLYRVYNELQDISSQYGTNPGVAEVVSPKITDLRQSLKDAMGAFNEADFISGIEASYKKARDLVQNHAPDGYGDQETDTTRSGYSEGGIAGRMDCEGGKCELWVTELRPEDYETLKNVEPALAEARDRVAT